MPALYSPLLPSRLNFRSTRSFLWLRAMVTHDHVLFLISHVRVSSQCLLAPGGLCHAQGQPSWALPEFPLAVPVSPWKETDHTLIHCGLS